MATYIATYIEKQRHVYTYTELTNDLPTQTHYRDTYTAHSLHKNITDRHADTLAYGTHTYMASELTPYLKQTLTIYNTT